MKTRYRIFLILGIIALWITAVWSFGRFNFNPAHRTGERIDSLNGVYVYYNGGVNNVSGRNTTAGGYNLGLKYQCVEFVKRYYFEYLQHKMPDSYGHAKDFFDRRLEDGQENKKRGLIQHTNPSLTKPRVNDLLIFDSTVFNRFGHVAIVSSITENEIEIIQQNPGQFGKSRESIALVNINGKWKIDSRRILGWLRICKDMK